MKSLSWIVYYGGMTALYFLSDSTESVFQSILCLATGENPITGKTSAAIMLFNLFSFLPFIIELVKQEEKYCSVKIYYCLRRNENNFYYEKKLKSVQVCIVVLMCKTVVDLVVLTVDKATSAYMYKSLLILSVLYFIFALKLCILIEITNMLASVNHYMIFAGCLCYVLLLQNMGAAFDVVSLVLTPIPFFIDQNIEIIMVFRLIFLIMISFLDTYLIRTRFSGNGGIL